MCFGGIPLERPSLLVHKRAHILNCGDCKKALLKIILINSSKSGVKRLMRFNYTSGDTIRFVIMTMTLYLFYARSTLCENAVNLGPT